ncbi:hypothetical protein DH2020_001249 [Rehmannia glutinosa]|uniref:Vacuolar protein sorting-associated protein n=1 Tax=Rehmannia glutinosa TaxID=99300 RepID=A0ABR0XZ84_REHGL
MQPGSDYFSLPHPIPQWPQGSGFATSRIKLGELEVCQITKFEFIWGCNLSMDDKHGVSFYKPISIPDGFFCLGHYCQSNEKPLRGFVLVAREVSTQHNSDYKPALLNPVDYSLVWISDDSSDENFDTCGYFWLPQPPEGYKALGVVTNKSEKPNLEEYHLEFIIRGLSIEECMGEAFPWVLFIAVTTGIRNGALLYKKGNSVGEAIDVEGSNLPSGGTNDGTYWIDLPCDSGRENFKRGNLESAKLYVHVKPALGGTFTDIVMWVFCPFNGPGTLKVGMMNIALSKVGQHVGDWEHFTLRISNFTGELWSVYFSQHSGGEWVEVYDLEFIEGNKAAVYSSRNGHASFPHPGNYIQGSSKLGIGVRNDADRSDFYVDSSRQYEIIAAEYLGDGVIIEPCWLQYMREWGPTIVYDSRTELDRIIRVLPPMVRYSMENMLNKLPLELYGEEGPTGPKEKNNWIGDERW